MDAEGIRTACLELPGAVEEFPFDEFTSVFKVVVANVPGKVFALSRLDREPPLQLNVKCDPEIALHFRATYPAITPGYHMNKKHWNTVILDGSIPDEMLHGMIEDSYDLVIRSFTRAQRAFLERSFG